MIIKFLKAKDIERGGYALIEIIGKKVPSGEEWGRAIFKNDKALSNKLQDFEPDDFMNIRMKEVKGKWRIQDFSHATMEDIEQAKTGGFQRKSSDAPATLPSAGNGDKMSKAEWAAKDKKKEESIARAVALKIANDNTKVGSANKTIIEMAKGFVPYLLGKEEEYVSSEQVDTASLAPPEI